jgi:hypothetical protein
MNQFAEAAKRTVKLCKESAVLSPPDAWQQAIDSLSTSNNVRRKSCPRNTFLGLCSDGFIRGIPPGEYNAPDNAERIYARKAVEILRKTPSLVDYPCKLWVEIGNGGKACDGQMDIVTALWKDGTIR